MNSSSATTDNTPVDPVTSLERVPVVSARLSTEGFAESWEHCQQIADFVARFSSSDRFDTERHATLLSSLLNELIELVFRMHVPSGEVALDVFKTGELLSIEIVVPVDAGTRESYRTLIEGANAGTSGDYLRARIREPAGRTGDVRSALIELADIYDIKLGLTDSDGGGSSVVVTMPVRFD